MPRARYLTWQPSGGISNQLRMMEWAIAAATVLNRTLLVPPGGPHTTRFWKHNEVPATDVVPMDEIIDLDQVRTRVGAEPIRGLSFLDFVDANYEHGRLLPRKRCTPPAAQIRRSRIARAELELRCWPR